jgi:thioester reductase-like protein
MIMRPFYFITGGMGSLGREIVPRLLLCEGSAEVVLLVRARDDAELRTRLAELARYLACYWPAVDRSRLRGLRGDVIEPRLGLDDASYRYLAGRVTHIIHGAACIDLGQSLEAARLVNVDGVREILRFADRCPRLTRLGYVSTAFVAGDRVGTILESELRCGQRFRNAYEQSKCEAEEIVRARMDRFPITVFRPSIIVGDSVDGHTCNFATLYRALRMIASGRIREIPTGGEARIDIVTVDYVAGAIAELIARPRTRGAVYHLTAGPARSLRAGAWIDAARGCAARDRASGDGAGVAAPPARPRREPSHEKLAIFFDYLGCEQAFDDAATQTDLGSGGLHPERPEIFLPRIFAFCTRTGWGRSLPWEERQWQPAA